MDEEVEKDLFWVAEYECEGLTGAVSRLEKERDTASSKTK